MQEQSLDFCAMHYLNQWYGQDRKYVEMLNEGEHCREEQLRMLKEAAAFYKVARNVPGNDKDDPKRERYEPIRSTLMRSSNTDFGTDTVRKIRRVERRLFDAMDSTKRVISLTTKMLWLKHQDDIIIYDALARSGLGTPGADLEEFYAIWQERYEEKRDEIYDAWSRLSQQVAYAYDAGHTSTADISHVTTFEWFHRRVFDIYLWFKGDAARS
jgi:hypothetical protein